MRWMLDTNAWIDLLKNPRSHVREPLRQQAAQVVTCAVVRAELLHGALGYGRPERRLELVRAALQPFASLPFDDRAAEHYAVLRHGLERTGERIGPHDLLIAAICLANECVLVSANVGEFRRVAGLRVEDWTRSGSG